MSDRSRDRAAARRRARLAARSDVEVEDQEEVPAQPDAAGGGLVRRLFPPAPPLPGKPPPLEGFSYNGPLRWIVERLWLLARSPLVWVAPGALWGLGQLADRQSAIGFLVSFLTFGAPLAAGWFGWRRPGLYGAAASLLGFVGATVYALLFFVTQGVSPLELYGPVLLGANLALQGAVYTAMGYLLGWYGGYLRRRQASVQAQRRPRR